MNRSSLTLALGLILMTLTVQAQRPGEPPWPGARPDGSVLLPNQWSLRPVGRQIALGDFPVNIAVHPSSSFAAILHSGYGRHEVVVINLRNSSIVARTNIDESFYGIEFSPKGERLFCSGAGAEVVHAFGFDQGRLTDHRVISVRGSKQRGVPAGMAVSRDGENVYVASVWGHQVSRLNVSSQTNLWDVAMNDTPETQKTLKRVPSSPDPDVAAATKRNEALLDETTSQDSFPYACRLDERRQRLYVSLWAQGAVAVVDLRTRRVVEHWPTGEHPNEMQLTKSGRWLYVANANQNTITVIRTDTGRTVETLSASLYPQSPPGSTPNSLALTPDEKTLFVANACNNNLAVFDVSEPGHSQPLGFIPVGWYPTSVRVTPDGKRLLVSNGKGLTSKPNLHGPQPGRKKETGTLETYIAGLFQGSLTILEIPSRREFERQLERYTTQAYQCSPLTADAMLSTQGQAGNPIPFRVGEPSPIRYCIFVIKENRTYDQVLGDLPQGNGDPGLCLFPESITPNHHQLAREFVLLDNFYVEAEVSADGHEWTVGAYATDFVEKFWPLSYGHNKSGKFPYPAEGRFTIAEPSLGYLWDRAAAAGISYRSYGEFVNNGKTLQDPGSSRVRGLKGHIDEWFRGWDLDYPDVKRIARFLSELKRFEREGEMPRLQILRLPNDHTYGVTVDKLTPRAMVADNDLALGQLVEGVTRSRFWPQTAIFVVEDDAQNGPDHVDAHRTIAFAISPYIKRGTVDSTLYSTSSMLRTMELILGLRPMSQFDAAALPMFRSFQAQPDLRPYDVRAVNVNLDERNLKTAWGSEKKMDFSKEDAADDLVLNEVIWRSIRGRHERMPAPTRAAFVFPHSKDEDDDD